MMTLVVSSKGALLKISGYICRADVWGPNSGFHFLGGGGGGSGGGGFRKYSCFGDTGIFGVL